jgi:type IV secretory pathway TrbD component
MEDTEREVSLADGRVIQGLTQPIFWAGVPRDLFFLNVLLAILMILIFHFWYFLAFAAVAHCICVYLGKREPFFYEIFFRYNRTRKYYWS